jgi:hypothetical protein
MADSLDANFQLGDTSVGSLVKSAASLENQINTYNDDEAAITYENSDKTDADFQTYSTYLEGRVTQLSATGTVTDATKALTMSQKIVSAQKSNISANVQRDAIAVLDGTGTDQEKLDDIQSGYQQLVAIGDDSGAQSLESTAYSLSQTIQLAAQTAATAAQTAATTFATNQVDSLDQYEAKVKETISNLATQIGVHGQEAFNKTAQQYDVANGINLPKGVQANQWDMVTSMIGITPDMTSYDLPNIVSAAVNAGESPNSPLLSLQFNSGSLLATQQAILKTLTPGTSQYNTVMNGMIGYLSGTTKLPITVSASGTPSEMSLGDALDAQQSAANGQPAVISEVQNGQTVFVKAAPTGWIYGKNQAGEYVPIQTTVSKGAAMTSAQSNAMKTMFAKAGFTVLSNSSSTGIMVQATSGGGNPSKIINNIPGLNGQGGTPIQVFAGKNNTYTFSFGGQIYQMAADVKNNSIGVYQVNSPNASGQVTTKLLGAEPGFDIKGSLPSQPIKTDLTGYLKDAGAAINTALGGKNVQQLVGIGEAKESVTQDLKNAATLATQLITTHTVTFNNNNGMTNLVSATKGILNAASVVVPKLIDPIAPPINTGLLKTVGDAVSKVGETVVNAGESAVKGTVGAVETGAKDVAGAIGGAAHAIGSIL